MSRFGLTVNAPMSQSAVDVMFVLDVTGSMQLAINGVRDGIIEFAHELETRKLDARVGLVAFRDRLNGRARPTPRPPAIPKGRMPRAGRSARAPTRCPRPSPRPRRESPRSRS